MANRCNTADLTINPATYTDVIPTVASDSVLVIAPNDDTVLIRAGAGEAVITLLAGTERRFGGGSGRESRAARWPIGAVALQIKSLAGVGPVKLIWE